MGLQPTRRITSIRRQVCLCVKAPVGVYLTKLLKVNMKNVEQLAKEHLITELCTNGKSAIIYVATVGYLERFAEAYMQDRLESLEPVAWKLRRADWVNGDYDTFLENHSWASESTPLYDISTLKDKP